MNIFLIRHGESEWNRLNKVQGLGDPGLSLEGKIQVERLSRALAQEKIDLVYTSPLLRAKQTAQAILLGRGGSIKELDSLKEITLGAWEGKSFEEISKLFKKEYQIWLKNPSKTKIPQAEKLNFFKKRVISAFKAVVKNNTVQNIAVVTHNGVISMFLSYIFKSDFDRIFHLLCINNASITRINFEGETFVVSSINETGHLEELRPLDDKYIRASAPAVRR